MTAVTKVGSDACMAGHGPKAPNFLIVRRLSTAVFQVSRDLPYFWLLTR